MYDPHLETPLPPTPAMTAVGLLCRMYMGWDHKNKTLAEGVTYLDKMKPNPNNMDYNYYATQVLHHYPLPVPLHNSTSASLYPSQGPCLPIPNRRSFHSLGSRHMIRRL